MFRDETLSHIDVALVLEYSFLSFHRSNFHPQPPENAKDFESFRRQYSFARSQEKRNRKNLAWEQNSPTERSREKTLFTAAESHWKIIFLFRFLSVAKIVIGNEPISIFKFFAIDESMLLKKFWNIIFARKNEQAKKKSPMFSILNINFPWQNPKKLVISLRVAITAVNRVASRSHEKKTYCASILTRFLPPPPASSVPRKRKKKKNWKQKSKKISSTHSLVDLLLSSRESSKNHSAGTIAITLSTFARKMISLMIRMKKYDKINEKKIIIK